MAWLWWRRFSRNTFYLPGHYSNDLIGTMMASSAKVRPFNWLSVQEMFWTEGGNTLGVYKLWTVGNPNPFLSSHHLLVPLGIFLITNILHSCCLDTESHCSIAGLFRVFLLHTNSWSCVLYLTFWCFEWSFPGPCDFVPTYQRNPLPRPFCFSPPAKHPLPPFATTANVMAHFMFECRTASRHFGERLGPIGCRWWWDLDSRHFFFVLVWHYVGWLIVG